MAHRLGYFVSAFGLLLSITGCAGNDAADEKKTIVRTSVRDSVFKATELEASVDALIEAIDETEPQDLQLNVILKTLSTYWEPVAVGANRAMGELEVDGAVESPDEQTGTVAIEKQVAMMQANIEQGSSGFGIAPFEQPLAEPINAAVEKGIPVITIDSDLPDSKRDFYIGTPNTEAGKTAGNSLLNLLPAGGGTVIILGHDDVGWLDGYNRSMGAKEVIEAAGYTVVIRRTVWDTDGEAQDLEYLTNALTTLDPPVVGMLGMFSNAYRCAMAAETVGRTANDIVIAAFDFDPKTVEYMQSGMIKLTHAQRQYYMGYMTPYILYGMNVLGAAKVRSILGTNLIDEHRINSGLDVIGADKLEDYYTFLDNLGIGGS